MNGFTTTRGGPATSLEVALLRGLAPDGGLYVPERAPSLAWPPAIEPGPAADDVRDVARWCAPALFPSVPPDVLDRVVNAALDFPIPVVEVEEGLWVLELIHGPTHAFKDVGARFMARLMRELDPTPSVRRTVLVATSGDTGGAVASAFHGMDGYRVLALFPSGGISERQRRQMTTLGGDVHAVAVRGTFDDCQRLAKASFANRELSERHGLTSANSINVARLLPQAFYYIHAAYNLRERWGVDDPGAWYVVPVGNLGNLCAGLLAARAGMPAAGFTAAANENRGFVDYLAGDSFEARPTIATTSSAMDVGNPSNLERIHWIFGADDAAVRASIRGASVDEHEVSRCIAALHERTGYIVDPHTAVAYAAATRQTSRSSVPRVVLATAHPAKFPETVEAATGREVPIPAGLLAAQEREERVRTIDATTEALRAVLEELEA
ncbi:MAG: threonine synthase [Gemmatimonadota bacterium]|nr:threonine synthase [Gemmatimonadota bacterium]